MAKRRRKDVNEQEPAAKRSKREDVDTQAQVSDEVPSECTNSDDVDKQGEVSGAPPKRPSLLGLPAELRNQILEDALDLEHDINGEIVLIEGSHQQPAIIRTNRQLRNDGLSMFYQLNCFTIKIKHPKLEPQSGHWVFKEPTSLMYFEGRKSRTNFKQWLKMYFDDRSTPRIPEPDYIREYCFELMVCQAFNIIDALAPSHLPWDMVETVLDAYLEGTEASSRFGDGLIWSS